MDIFHAVGVSESKGSEVLYDCKGIKCKFSDNVFPEKFNEPLINYTDKLMATKK